MQYLGQGRRTRAHGQDRRERVQLCLHALGKQVRGQLRLDDLQTPVDQSQSAVHAVHGAADVPGALAGDERVEQGKGLDFAAGGVEERRAEHVHALHVDRRVARDVIAAVVAAAAAGRGSVFDLLGDAGRRVDQELHLPSSRRGRTRLGSVFRLGVVDFPGDRVEQPDQAGFGDATLEQRVGCQGAERVVANLRVRRRAAAVDEGEVVVRRNGGYVQEDQPQVYAICGLAGRELVESFGLNKGKGSNTHHSVSVSVHPS